MIATESLPLEALTAAYDIGPWEAVRLLPGGKSQHFHVTTPRGRFVVRRSYRSKTPESMRFEHELMMYLCRNGFPAPEVVPTVDGETHVAVDSRLYRITMFMQGTGYQSGNPHHLVHVARTLATFHRLMASFQPSSPGPRGKFVHEGLRERLAELRACLAKQSPSNTHASPTSMYGAPLTPENGADDPPVQKLLELLPFTLAEAEATWSLLDRVYSRLPLVTVHGGCRRGSFLFDGDRLAAALDFDSSHLEARVLDLAVALHDFGKVYGDPDSVDFKVPLDPEVVGRFLGAYQEVSRLEPAEMEALPALLTAKRLKRALGRFHRLAAGEEIFSLGDARKILTEVARVRWLDGQREQLQLALGRA
jgi:homoserine kinase type II